MKSYFSKPAQAPARQDFAEFPVSVGSYRVVGQQTVAEDVQAVLKADDSVLRVYRNPGGMNAELFMAYYAVQRAGESMHSPKNCLPGSGWEPVVNDEVQVTNPDGSDPQKINRYIIEKDGSRALVLYWYQTQGRVIANEYWGKFYLVADALRTGRRDGAIVRVVVPMDARLSTEAATARGLEFASLIRPELPKFLPK
jgi:EpsI family protein